MGSLFRSGRRAAYFALLLILTSFCCLLSAQAQGGFALSGSFYAQEFELPQGASLKAPDVYVVVFNNTDADFDVKMTTETPLGVKLVLSEDDFHLRAGEQKKVEVGVEVTLEAAPGEYEISVTAEPYKEGVSGIQIMGAAGQSARLVVVGEGAQVTAQIVNPDGAPVPGVIRLFKLMAGQSYEVAYSETGTVEATVAPGSYAAAAYMAGEKLAEESCEVAADEEKSITLTVKTVYFEGFGLVPNYRKGTEELAFAQVVYTVKNLYKPVEKAEVILRTSFNDAPLDEVSLANLSPLEMGRVGLNYNYIPAAGWRSGSYGFKLELYLEGKPYATTAEEKLSVGMEGKPSATTAEEEPGVERLVTSKPRDVTSVPWGLIGWIITVILAIAGAVYILMVSRKKK
jgi:hypothetical protein